MSDVSTAQDPYVSGMPTPTGPGALNRRFATVDEGLKYINGLIGAGVPFQASRRYQDQFKKNKRNRHLLLLGVSRTTDAECQRLMPGGTWGIEVEPPHTDYEVCGILGPRLAQTSYFRASAWYSRYLPYAWAMCRAEYDFRCVGVDFNSINGYYGTVAGYCYLGRGDDDTDTWQRLDAEDRALYERIYDVSMGLRSPDLPFYEALQPALAFVAVQRPDLLRKHTEPDNWQWQHACAVLSKLGLPVPSYKAPRRAS